jgi:hypothetical protein
MIAHGRSAVLRLGLFLAAAAVMAPEGHAVFGQQRAAGEGVLGAALRQRYEQARLNTIEAAEFMPEGDFQYRLSPKQRMYGEWFGHTAVMNFRMCSAMRGEAAPDGQELPGSSSKSEYLAELKRSFEYCDETYRRAETDAALLGEVAAGGRKVVPAIQMVDHVVALNEHYGNLVGYLRTKGITPPTTARREKAQQQQRKQE